MAKKTKRTDIPFAQKLVLNAYMLDQIGFKDFESVAKVLSDVKEGLDFKKQGDKPNLEYLEYLTRNKVVLDWYPKIQAIKAKGVADGVMHQKEENVIPADNLAFIDWNRIYLEMQVLMKNVEKELF